MYCTLAYVLIEFGLDSQKYTHSSALSILKLIGKSLLSMRWLDAVLEGHNFGTRDDIYQSECIDGDDFF